MLSEWWLLALSGVLTAVVIRWLVDYCLYLRRLPPGPWGVPVVGYLPWLTGKPFRDFVPIAKQYGGMFSVRMGSNIAVVLNDWPAVKATLIDQGKAFADRKFNHITHTLFTGHDVIFKGGDIWRQQRNLTIQAIKKVSKNNKQSMENRFADMVHQMAAEMRKLDGRSADLSEMVGDGLAQGNWNLISYIDVVESNAELHAVKGFINFMSHAVRVSNPLGVLNWLRFVPPTGFGFWECQRVSKRLREYFKALIKKHYEQLDTGNDVIDNYIQEIKNNPGGKAPYNDEHLLGTVIDLVGASIETSSSTCMWGLLYLVLNPRVQGKVREELERVIGHERLVTMDDFPNLPYLDAFVKEVHRKGSVVPLSIPHATSKTVHINGYVIPKGTLCIQNIHAIHHDPSLWKEPEVFLPERFMAEDGSVISPPYLMPFSVGPRVCIGQFVAETQLRLVFASLLQQFTFSVPAGQPEPSPEPIVGTVLYPQPFQIYVKCNN